MGRLGWTLLLTHSKPACVIPMIQTAEIVANAFRLARTGTAACSSECDKALCAVHRDEATVISHYESDSAVHKQLTNLCSLRQDSAYLKFLPHTCLAIDMLKQSCGAQRRAH